MKYKNIKTNGYHSKKEAKRAFDLKMLEKAGVITDLKEQVSFDLIVNGMLICRYVCDFQYMKDGKLITEDVKGYKDKVYRIKRKLMLAIHNIDIFET